MIRRFHAALLLELLDLFPVVAVVGARQVGKSTLVTTPEIGGNREYRTLDDLAWRTAAQSDPKAFLEGPQRLTIDEVQLVPELLREVKLLTDRDRVPGKFLLTGSADLDHCADLSHVLAGRVGILRLPPIALSEVADTRSWKLFLEAASVRDLDAAFAGRSYAGFAWDRIWSGGFPLSLLAKTSRERRLWMDSFRTTYLERDLRRISDIANLADFVRLMTLSCGVTGGLLNQASLARDAGMSPATAGRHLSILEASFLIHRLPPFFTNIGKRFVKAPKLHWTDTGLASHLLSIRDRTSLERNPTLKGRLVETLVMMEILSLLPLLDTPAQLFHVRTHDQLEVDGLVQTGKNHLLIEVKASETVTAMDAKSIERWIDLNPSHGPGAVIHLGREFRPLSKHVRAIPISAVFGQRAQ